MSPVTKRTRRIASAFAAGTRRRLSFARRVGHDTGAATAEYAITILAAVGFAGLLVVILRSDAVRQMLTDLVHHALSFAG